MTDTSELRQHYSETETGVLLSKWSDRTLLDWAETILREELLARGFSELQLAEFRTKHPINKSNATSPKSTLTHSAPESFIVQKLFAVVMAVIFFCMIMGTPFYIWQNGVDHSSGSGNGSLMDFILGMSMVIWVPLLGMVAFYISASVARLLWPTK